MSYSYNACCPFFQDCFKTSNILILVLTNILFMCKFLIRVTLDKNGLLFSIHIIKITNRLLSKNGETHSMNQKKNNNLYQLRTHTHISQKAKMTHRRSKRNEPTSKWLTHTRRKMAWQWRGEAKRKRKKKKKFAITKNDASGKLRLATCPEEWNGKTESLKQLYNSISNQARYLNSISFSSL